MITGAHVILYSSDADADRAFLRDLLGTTTVDAGGGWLILALPPGEVAVHPTDGPVAPRAVPALRRHRGHLRRPHHERRRGRGGDQRPGLGRLITLRLPGGGALGVYEPRHPVAAGS